MRVIDLSNRRKNEEQMQSVLENEHIRIEAKNGKKLESINLSATITDVDNAVAVACGTGEDVVKRTVECIVNLGTSIMTHIEDPVEAKVLMGIAFETAMDIFDGAVAEVEKKDDHYKVELKVGAK